MNPYELYIRFLVTKGYNETDAVNAELDKLGLHHIKPDYFKKQFDLVHKLVPAPISKQIIDGKYYGEFYQWMKTLEVAALWDYEKPFFKPDQRYIKLVYDIHMDPKMRLTINALLLKGTEHKDLVQDLTIKFTSMLKDTHLKIYETFFWNVKRMSRGAWRSYLKVCDDFETAILFVALTETLDTLRTELELPSKVSLSDSLQFLLSKSMTRAKRYLRLDTPDANKEARSWIKTVMDLSDKYAKHRTGDMDDFGKTLQMEFDYIIEDFPSPDEAVVQELKKKFEVQQQ